MTLLGREEAVSKSQKESYLLSDEVGLQTYACTGKEEREKERETDGSWLRKYNGLIMINNNFVSLNFVNM